MEKYNQFIIYTILPSKNRTGKKDKIPVNWRTGQPANAHDPKIWLSLDQARIKAKELNAGVGFVFTDNDPFFFLDIDEAYDGSKWSNVAIDLATRFGGAYT